MNNAGEQKLIDGLAEKLACAKDDAIIRGIVEAVREGRITVTEEPLDITYDWSGKRGAETITANMCGGVRVVFPEIERQRERIAELEAVLEPLIVESTATVKDEEECAFCGIWARGYPEDDEQMVKDDEDIHDHHPDCPTIIARRVLHGAKKATSEGGESEA